MSSKTNGAGPVPALEGVDHNGLVVGKWKTSLFLFYADCVPNGMMACACPGISMAQVCARLGLVNFYVLLGAYASLYILAVLAAVTNADTVVTLVVVSSMLAALFTTRIRWRMRYLFSIPGSVLEDLAASCFCGCCAIAQMASHAESYHPGDCAFAPRATLQGYTFG